MTLAGDGRYKSGNGQSGSGYSHSSESNRDFSHGIKGKSSFGDIKDSATNTGSSKSSAQQPSRNGPISGGKQQQGGGRVVNGQ